MRPMKNFRKTILAGGVLIGLMFAQNAAALVTIAASSAADGTTQSIGFTFDVDVNVTWDGSGMLTGIFASHTWDSSQLALIGADSTLGAPGDFETRPNIMGGTMFAPNLSRFGTIAAGLAGDDLSSSARTVQYGSIPAIPAGQAQTNLVVRLTFEVIGVGDGVAEIAGAILPADDVQGDTFAFGPDVTITVPEPTSAMLALSAIGSVFAVVSIRRRD